MARSKYRSRNDVLTFEFRRFKHELEDRAEQVLQFNHFTDQGYLRLGLGILAVEDNPQVRHCVAVWVDQPKPYPVFHFDVGWWKQGATRHWTSRCIQCDRFVSLLFVNPEQFDLRCMRCLNIRLQSNLNKTYVEMVNRCRRDPYIFVRDRLKKYEEWCRKVEKNRMGPQGIGPPVKPSRTLDFLVEAIQKGPILHRKEIKEEINRRMAREQASSSR